MIGVLLLVLALINCNASCDNRCCVRGKHRAHCANAFPPHRFPATDVDAEKHRWSEPTDLRIHQQTKESHPSTYRRPLRRRTPASAIFSERPLISRRDFDHSTSNWTAASCRWLRGFKHQRNQCQKRRGFAEILARARRLAVTHCQEQFEYATWNCSYRADLFKTVYRETALMQAMATAALVYTTALACSDGKLQNCYCAAPDEEPPSKRDWRWGGCGDNTGKARNIARRFMLAKQPKDGLREVLSYNTEVGIRAVLEGEMEACSCHGPSASCTLKVCWKRLRRPFDGIARKLRDRYHSAIIVNASNSVRRQSLVKKTRLNNNLLYLTDMSFCNTTAGRRCRDVHDCATLCCARGYTEKTIAVRKRCHLRCQERCVNVTFDTCEVTESVFHCK